METFGQRLKSLIKQSDMRTVKGFAEKANLHPGSVSNIIRGERNPSFDVIQACIDIFSDADTLWLLTGRRMKSMLELENKQLKEQVHFYEEKLGTIVKRSSNRINPQPSFPGFERHFANELMRKTV